MKRKILRMTAMALCFGLLLPGTSKAGFDPNYQPPENSKYAADKAVYRTTSPHITMTVDNVSQNNGKKNIQVTYTIAADASGELALTFDEITKALIEEGYINQPGDEFNVSIKIVNNSAYDYNYKDESLIISSLDMSLKTADFDGVGFDQQPIPMEFTNFRIRNKAIQALYGYANISSITIDNLINLDAQLAVQGYTGDHALTQYYLDYYNSLYGTSAACLEDLNLNAIKSVFGDSNALTSQTFASPAQAQAYYLTLLDHPTYHVTMDARVVGSKVELMLYESEKEIVEWGYNVFYNEIFSLSLDNSAYPLSGSNYNTYSIGGYMRKNTPESKYAEANEILQQCNIDAGDVNNTLSDVKYRLNGSLLVNAYQGNSFGYALSFILAPTALGTNVTLNKIDASSGDLITDQAEFILYKLVSGNKVYYGENNTWVLTPEEALVLVTVDGSLSITGLEAGEYGFIETKAPEGYELASDALTFVLTSAQTDAVMAFKNEKVPEITDATDTTEDTEDTETTEPTEDTEDTETTEPTEVTEATESTESTKPTETKPTDSNKATSPTKGGNNAGGGKTTKNPKTSDTKSIQMMGTLACISLMTLIGTGMSIKMKKARKEK